MKERRFVWCLWHFDIGEDVDELEVEDADDAIELSWKRLGYYASQAAAEAARARAAGHARFRAYPGGFRIYRDWLDHIGWSGGFVTGCD